MRRVAGLVRPAAATLSAMRMLFYVDVTVVRAIPDDRGPTPVAARTWHDTVSCRFAVNAAGAPQAIEIASEASRHAVDQNGDFVGGIVTDARAIAISPDDLNGHEAYLIKPLHEEGIVYVSGIAYSSIGYDAAPGVDRELSLMRESIASRGLPDVSFTHPNHDTPYKPEICRLMCPSCGHWVEYDQRAFIFAFFDGIQYLPAEFARLRSARTVHDSFLDRHGTCFPFSEAIELEVHYLHEGDDEFSHLDYALCEGKDSGIT